MKNYVNVFTVQSHIINIHFYICATNRHVPDEFVNFAENKVARNYSALHVSAMNQLITNDLL